MQGQISRLWRERAALGRRAAMLLAPCFAGGAGGCVAFPSEPDRWIVFSLCVAVTLFAIVVWRFDRGRWPLL
jgi:hypothetical protein